MEAVAAFTDTYLPTVNGVTYTIRTWRQRWRDRGGRMDVVYPEATGYVPEAGERPVTSFGFPFYAGYRYALPAVPRPVHDVDVVHVHTPFTLGLAGLRLARAEDLPLVASYHTPTGEYTDYIAPRPVSSLLRGVSEYWERAFLDRADVVLVPSEVTREHVVGQVGVTTRVETLPNGVDVERFRPVETAGFRARHGLDTLDPDRPLVGYTGRHGHEKRLDLLVEAAAGLDATVVLAGDGPARSDLERLAEDTDVDVRFLGFLERDELPAFYASLDVFAFPSPVETQGIVALEAMACGTPVVAAEAGALTETVEDGVTGLHFEPGDVEGFRQAIRRSLDERDRLGEACLDRRETTSVAVAVDRLAALYGSLVE